VIVAASAASAASAAAAGGKRPRPLVFTAVLLAIAGTSVAGVATDVPLWLLALTLAAVGIGIANTGSLGLLVEAVPVQRIVTAIVVWPQIGIIGYLLGPLAGGCPHQRVLALSRSASGCPTQMSAWQTLGRRSSGSR
jgi:MFS family permease